MYFEETMSREYLQGLVQMKKKADYERHVDGLVKKIMEKIGAAAATGATCYLYEIEPNTFGNIEAEMRLEATLNFQNAQSILTGVVGKRTVVTQQHVTQHLQRLQGLLPPTLWPLPITHVDIVEALKLKCPGCNVSYMENWQGIHAPIYEDYHKRGIYISWG
jgi:hypothetical protein